MLSLRIVEHLNIIEHILSGILSGFVGLASYPFPLEQIEKALRDGTIVAVPAPAHGMFQIVSLEERSPIHTGELGALVGMDQDLTLWFSAPYSHEQRL